MLALLALLALLLLLFTIIAIILDFRGNSQNPYLSLLVFLALLGQRTARGTPEPANEKAAQDVEEETEEDQQGASRRSRAPKATAAVVQWLQGKEYL